jgi:hypothetical protein
MAGYFLTQKLMNSVWDGSMKAAMRGELGSKFVGGEQSQNKERHANR